MPNPLKSFRSRYQYDERERPFLDHLEELRKMLIRAALAIGIGMAISAGFVPWLTEILRRPAQTYIDAGQIVLQHPEVTSGFTMWFTLALWGGVLISMPALMMIIGAFVLPGVKDSERRIIQRVAGFSGVLFIIGVVVGYKMTLPLAMKIMLGLSGKLGGTAIWNYQKFIDFSLQVLLGFGLALQLPVVIILLGRLGFLTARQLMEKRRHVVVGILILSMMLTPPDVTTQILMAVPLILLYEVCIWFLFFTVRPKAEIPEETLETDEPISPLNEE